MKAFFVSIAALAVSAFAAPSVAGGSLAAHGAAVALPEFDVIKRAQTAEELVSAIDAATGNINTIGVSINVTLGNVKAGSITQEEGIAQTRDDLKKLIDEVGALVAQVLAAVHVAVPKQVLQLVLNAVGGLIQAVVLILGAVVDTLGYGGIPYTLLSIVVDLVNSLLTGLVDVLGRDVVPGLLLIVQDLVGDLPNELAALLGPLLKLVAGLLGQI